MNIASSARKYFDGVLSLLNNRSIPNARAMFGEITSNQDCDQYTKSMARQLSDGYRQSLLFSSHGSLTTFRAWNYHGDNCYIVPSYLRDAYNATP